MAYFLFLLLFVAVFTACVAVTSYEQKWWLPIRVFAMINVAAAWLLSIIYLPTDVTFWTIIILGVAVFLAMFSREFAVTYLPELNAIGPREPERGPFSLAYRTVAYMFLAGLLSLVGMQLFGRLPANINSDLGSGVPYKEPTH